MKTLPIIPRALRIMSAFTMILLGALTEQQILHKFEAKERKREE